MIGGIGKEKSLWEEEKGEKVLPELTSGTRAPHVKVIWSLLLYLNPGVIVWKEDLWLALIVPSLSMAWLTRLAWNKMMDRE